MKMAAGGLWLKARHSVLGVGGLAFVALSYPAHADFVKAGNLEIVDPWSKEVAPGSSIRRAFFVVRNNGSTDDQLMSVLSPISETAEIHGGKQAALWHEMAEKDVVARAYKGGIVIPAKGETEFKPGSFYVMFVDLKTVTPKGKKFTATLTFKKAGKVDVDFLVDARPIVPTGQ
jgi:copper(I)-binding protein